MDICCGCGTKLDFDTPGVLIQPVSAQPSPKSGRPVAKGDCFPDGDTQKFICVSCLFKTETARMLGFYNQSDDSDLPEVTLESTYVHSMPDAYISWAAGYKP